MSCKVQKQIFNAIPKRKVTREGFMLELAAIHEGVDAEKAPRMKHSPWLSDSDNTWLAKGSTALGSTQYLNKIKVPSEKTAPGMVSFLTYFARNRHAGDDVLNKVDHISDAKNSLGSGESVYDAIAEAMSALFGVEQLEVWGNVKIPFKNGQLTRSCALSAFDYLLVNNSKIGRPFFTPDVRVMHERALKADRLCYPSMQSLEEDLREYFDRHANEYELPEDWVSKMLVRAGATTKETGAVKARRHEAGLEEVIIEAKGEVKIYTDPATGDIIIRITHAA